MELGVTGAFVFRSFVDSLWGPLPVRVPTRRRNSRNLKVRYMAQTKLLTENLRPWTVGKPGLCGSGSIIRVLLNTPFACHK